MSRAALVRLASFALVIAGTFGTAYGVGRKLPGNPESRPHTHGPQARSPIPPGFAVDGYVLVTDATQPSAASMALHIKGPDGKRITEFPEVHGSKLHVVVIRPDLSGFQHLHPDIGADGSFVVPIDQPGKWHIVVDTQPAGATAPVVLATNVDDEVPVDTVKLPAPADDVIVGDLSIVHRGLNFTVTTKGGSVADGLEPFIGQAAHLIAIRQGDLAYTHLHPVAAADATFSFAGTLPTGTYRLFLQFGYRGAVITAAFTVVQP
jgi:hypothetical protein